MTKPFYEFYDGAKQRNDDNGTKQWVSEVYGKCEFCEEEDNLFYNDNGDLICCDCLFESEIYNKSDNNEIM